MNEIEATKAEIQKLQNKLAELRESKLEETRQKLHELGKSAVGKFYRMHYVDGGPDGSYLFYEGEGIDQTLHINISFDERMSVGRYTYDYSSFGSYIDTPYCHEITKEEFMVVYDRLNKHLLGSLYKEE